LLSCWRPLHGSIGAIRAGYFSEWRLIRTFTSPVMAKKLFSILLLLLLMVCSCVRAQETWSDHATGLQFGYANFGYNQLEFGLNHYWSYVKSFDPTKEKFTELSHTFGPSLSAIAVYKNNSAFYVGPKLGFNYAFPNALSGRICPSIEIFPGHGTYVGADAGASLLGIFFFYGYYAPLSSSALTGYNRHRFGIRIILNEAPVNTSGAFF
jgi:hypothetical protein